MAKRVTVSIPDMLHEQMEKWRESFNLSKMFQESVAEAIQKKEEFQKRFREDREMTDIIERLRREKARSEQNYFDKGKDDGYHWGRSAGYEELIHALAWQPGDDILRDPMLGSYFSQQAVKNNLMEGKEGSLKPYMAIYLDGWRTGLAEFWDAVKDKLNG